MARLAAFLCLACAAFAWVPPGIDRAGLAALGFACLAWSIGRPLRIPWHLVPQPAQPAGLEPGAQREALSPELVQQLATAMQAELAADNGAGLVHSDEDLPV